MSEGSSRAKDGDARILVVAVLDGAPLLRVGSARLSDSARAVVSEMELTHVEFDATNGTGTNRAREVLEGADSELIELVRASSEAVAVVLVLVGVDVVTHLLDRLLSLHEAEAKLGMDKASPRNIRVTNQLEERVELAVMISNTVGVATKELVRARAHGLRRTGRATSLVTVAVISAASGGARVPDLDNVNMTSLDLDHVSIEEEVGVGGASGVVDTDVGRLVVSKEEVTNLVIGGVVRHEGHAVVLTTVVVDVERGDAASSEVSNAETTGEDNGRRVNPGVELRALGVLTLRKRNVANALSHVNSARARTVGDARARIGVVGTRGGRGDDAVVGLFVIDVDGGTGGVLAELKRDPVLVLKEVGTFNGVDEVDVLKSDHVVGTRGRGDSTGAGRKLLGVVNADKSRGSRRGGEGIESFSLLDVKVAEGNAASEGVGELELDGLVDVSLLETADSDPVGATMVLIGGIARVEGEEVAGRGLARDVVLNVALGTSSRAEVNPHLYLTTLDPGEVQREHVTGLNVAINLDSEDGELVSEDAAIDSARGGRGYGRIDEDTGRETVIDSDVESGARASGIDEVVGERSILAGVDDDGATRVSCVLAAVVGVDSAALSIVVPVVHAHRVDGSDVSEEDLEVGEVGLGINASASNEDARRGLTGGGNGDRGRSVVEELDVDGDLDIVSEGLEGNVVETGVVARGALEAVSGGDGSLSLVDIRETREAVVTGRSVFVDVDISGATNGKDFELDASTEPALVGNGDLDLVVLVTTNVVTKRDGGLVVHEGELSHLELLEVEAVSLVVVIGTLVLETEPHINRADLVTGAREELATERSARSNVLLKRVVEARTLGSGASIATSAVVEDAGIRSSLNGEDVGAVRSLETRVRHHALSDDGFVVELAGENGGRLRIGTVRELVIDSGKLDTLRLEDHLGSDGHTTGSTNVLEREGVGARKNAAAANGESLSGTNVEGTSVGVARRKRDGRRGVEVDRGDAAAIVLGDLDLDAIGRLSVGSQRLQIGSGESPLNERPSIKR